MEEKAKQAFRRHEDRMPFIERALREAPGPLTIIQICERLGWGTDSDHNAVRRIVRRYPSRYRPTSGKQRNERYTFVDPLAKPPGVLSQLSEAAVQAGVDGEGPTISPSVPELGRLREENLRFRLLITEIQKIVEEARQGQSNQAFFSLGEIHSLLKHFTDQAVQP